MRTHNICFHGEKNASNEVFLMSAYNIHFLGEIRKISVLLGTFRLFYHFFFSLLLTIKLE